MSPFSFSIGEIIDFDGNTYIDFYYDTSLGDVFSIKALKKECNKYLDEDKSEEDQEGPEINEEDENIGKI